MHAMHACQPCHACITCMHVRHAMHACHACMSCMSCMHVIHVMHVMHACMPCMTSKRQKERARKKLSWEERKKGELLNVSGWRRKGKKKERKKLSPEERKTKRRGRAITSRIATDKIIFIVELLTPNSEEANPNKIDAICLILRIEPSQNIYRICI